jgi:hypothetical protein
MTAPPIMPVQRIPANPAGGAHFPVDLGVEVMSPLDRRIGQNFVNFQDSAAGTDEIELPVIGWLQYEAVFFVLPDYFQGFCAIGVSNSLAKTFNWGVG